MAKGNMLLGYSRGSVGDVTFYRDGGEQRARARNRKPNNPRSNRQMYQRAKFAGAVKFFKQSLANFYKMAFENKKPNESDYNAFMRVNLAQSPLMSKSAFDKPGYPAIGHWTISQGSMPTLRFEKNYGTSEDALAVILPVKTDETVTNETTIGQFSSILINSGLYMAGDIFTMVRVYVDADSEQLATIPTATPEGNWNTYWTVTQIILDTNDPRKIGLELLREDAGELIFKNTDGYIYIGNKGDDGMSLVTTRNTSTGLKASNSEIVVTDTIEAAITTAQGDNYKNAVLADWRASGENILQGSLATGVADPMLFITANELDVECGATAQDAYDDPSEVSTTSNRLELTAAQKYISAITNVLTFDNAEHAAQAYILFGGTSGQATTNLTYKPFLFNYNYINFAGKTVTLSSNTVRINASAASAAEVEVFTNGGGLNVYSKNDEYTKQWVVRVGE